MSQDDLIDAIAAVAPDQAPSRRSLSKWENGHTCPTVDDLTMIARATRFPIVWFVTDLEVPRTPHDPGGQGILRSGCDGEILPFRARRIDAPAVAHYSHQIAS